MQTEHLQAERRAKRFWVSLVVLLLSLQIAVGAMAITLAIGDPSVAVVPDYHEAALNWDQTHAAHLAAQRLGWTIDVVASDVADGRGMRAIQVHLADSQQQPVDALSVEATIYHHARAGQVQRLALPSVGEGRYLAMARMPQHGLWQVDVAIDGGEERMQRRASFRLAE